MTREALADLVVLDVSGSVATGYCGHLMAALGARVVDVESPRTGHPTRRLPPFAPTSDPGDGAPGASALHSWIAARKQSVECDPRSAEGRARLLELCATADVLLEAFRPGELAAMGIDRAALEAANPALIVVSMPWFGAGGPLAGFLGGDPLIASLVGTVRTFGPAEGPPMLPSGHGSQIVAGASAFIATLGHLIGRARGRIRGAHVDANVLESNLCLTNPGTIGVFNACAVPPRLGWNRYWPTYPAGIYRAKDGWIGVTCEQFVDRGAFARYEVAGHGAFRAPGVPFRLAQTPARAGGEAPRLGEHSGIAIAPLRPTAPSRQPGPSRPPTLAATAPARRANLLDGIRVVDLTMGWAGPLAARHLGDLGAEVVKVESCRHFDWWRGWDTTPEGRALHVHEKSSAFAMANRNKLGVTLDLTMPRGVELVKRLVAVSDVVVENYAATVLPKLGLGWDALVAVNPALIMISMPPFGATGPWRGYRAYGSTVEQASGLPHLQGEEGAPPMMQHVALGDPIAGIYGAAALLTALWHRERTGEGQLVDLSHVEALFAMGVEGFLEQEIAGRPAPRLGRRHHEHAPHGVYPGAGVDRWITITITDDAQWRALGDLMAVAVPPLLWPREERFATAAGRKANEDEIDRGLAEWTMLRDRDLLANKLQNLGIPAAPIYDVGEVLGSPQLVARGFWQWMEREWMGRQPNPSVPYRPAGGGPCGIDFPAPTLGQHNEAVLGSILGLSSVELQELRDQAVTGNTPAL